MMIVMKKTYIIPAILATEVAQCLPIASSNGDLSKSGQNYTGGLKNEEAQSDGLVKDNSYDVWSDDWSK